MPASSQLDELRLQVSLVDNASAQLKFIKQQFDEIGKGSGADPAKRHVSELDEQLKKLINTISQGPKAVLDLTRNFAVAGVSLGVFYLATEKVVKGAKELSDTMHDMIVTSRITAIPIEQLKANQEFLERFAHLSSQQADRLSTKANDFAIDLTRSMSTAREAMIAGITPDNKAFILEQLASIEKEETAVGRLGKEYEALDNIRKHFAEIGDKDLGVILARRLGELTGIDRALPPGDITEYVRKNLNVLSEERAKQIRERAAVSEQSEELLRKLTKPVTEIGNIIKTDFTREGLIPAMRVIDAMFTKWHDWMQEGKTPSAPAAPPTPLVPRQGGAGTSVLPPAPPAGGRTGGPMGRPLDEGGTPAPLVPRQGGAGTSVLPPAPPASGRTGGPMGRPLRFMGDGSAGSSGQEGSFANDPADIWWRRLPEATGASRIEDRRGDETDEMLQSRGTQTKALTDEIKRLNALLSGEEEPGGGLGIAGGGGGGGGRWRPGGIGVGPMGGGGFPGGGGGGGGGGGPPANVGLPESGQWNEQPFQQGGQTIGAEQVGPGGLPALTQPGKSVLEGLQEFEKAGTRSSGAPGGSGGPTSAAGPVHPGTMGAIEDASREFGLNPAAMKAYASIESSFTPESNRNRSDTQYKGLYQIGREEWKQYGSGDIYNARDNARAAGRMLADHKNWFTKQYGREPTPGELYMIHQQGRGFFTRGAMTNIGGNPYPGMGGPQTHESFERGWTAEVNKRMAKYLGPGAPATAGGPGGPGGPGVGPGEGSTWRGTPAAGAAPAATGPGGWTDLPRDPGAKDWSPGPQDRRIREIMSAARDQFETLHPGFKLKGVSGFRGGTGQSQHGTGTALDVRITDPEGKQIQFTGNDPTGMYHELARIAKGEQMARYPGLNERFAWGGAFGTQLGGGGPPDLMHFDLGGERGHWTQALPSRMGPLPGLKYGKPVSRADSTAPPGAPSLEEAWKRAMERGREGELGTQEHAISSNATTFDLEEARRSVEKTLSPKKVEGDGNITVKVDADKKDRKPDRVLKKVKSSRMMQSHKSDDGPPAHSEATGSNEGAPGADQ